MIAVLKLAVMSQTKPQKSTAVFLGAGFSKWAAELPVANQLFDFEIDPFGPMEKDKLFRLKELNKTWNGKNPGGLAEQFIADMIRSSKEDEQLVCWYVTRRLSEPFIKTAVYQGRKKRGSIIIDDSSLKEMRGVQRAFKFLSAIPRDALTGVITTNYDLLVEYALGTKGFNYGEQGQTLHGRMPYPISMRIHPVVLTGEVTLTKIHGSISWDKDRYYCDGRRGITGNAQIVPPYPGKDPREELPRAWALATGVLQKAERIVVCGFAFNPYDRAVLDLLLNAGSGVKSALILDLNADKLTENANRLWPGAKVSVCSDPENFVPAIVSFFE